MKRLKEQEEEVENEMPFFEALRKFARGQITFAQLKEVDESNLLVAVDVEQPLGSSVLHLRFDDDEKLLEAINVDENDIWFLNSVFSSYSSYEFYDYYTIESDFEEGYIVFYDLDDDSKHDLEEIAKLLLNEKFDLDNDKYRIELAKRLREAFPDEIDSILTDYRVYKDEEMEKTAQDSIHSEIKEVLKEKGFHLERGFYKISTKVTNLLHLYMLVDDKLANLEQLIKQLYSDTNIGGWDENRYEFQDYSNFDGVRFNRDVRNQLEKIKNKIEENVDIKKYFELYDNITSKFQLDKWYKLPSATEYTFRINNIDVNDLMISMTLKNRAGHMKQLPKLTEEGFLKFIYNPQLFGLSDLFF